MLHTKSSEEHKNQVKMYKGVENDEYKQIKLNKKKWGK